MKNFIILIMLVAFSGCASFYSTTANRGISYGMSKDEVIKVNESKGYQIISSDANTVVVDGIQEQSKQLAIKTFYFNDGKLIQVSERIK